MSVTAQKLRLAELDGANQNGPLDQAMTRLKTTVETMEALLHRRELEQKSAEALEEELQVLLQDRARLANELDHVKARASKLDAVSAEVAGRLDTVLADIGTVLGGR